MNANVYGTLIYTINSQAPVHKLLADVKTERPTTNKGNGTIVVTPFRIDTLE